MTPEREKYLAGISKEERKIRFAIATEKSVMKLCKDSLATCNSSITLNANKTLIAKEKTIIKVLKKQLPAPFWVSKSNTYYCPICGNMANNGREYCSYCGQKLR